MPPTDYQEEKGSYQLIISMIHPLHNLSKVVFVDKWNKSQHYECDTVGSKPQFDIFSAITVMPHPPKLVAGGT